MLKAERMIGIILKQIEQQMTLKTSFKASFGQAEEINQFKIKTCFENYL